MENKYISKDMVAIIHSAFNSRGIDTTGVDFSIVRLCGDSDNTVNQIFDIMEKEKGFSLKDWQESGNGSDKHTTT